MNATPERAGSQGGATIMTLDWAQVGHLVRVATRRILEVDVRGDLNAKPAPGRGCVDLPRFSIAMERAER